MPMRRLEIMLARVCAAVMRSQGATNASHDDYLLPEFLPDVLPAEPEDDGDPDQAAEFFGFNPINRRKVKAPDHGE